MSGSLNRLAPQLPDDSDPTDANYGARYVLPRFNPPGTYTGVIPTPPNNYAATSGEFPPAYYHMQQFMNQLGPNDPRLNQLLQLLYLRQQGRT